jgi:hypothetical protein
LVIAESIISWRVSHFTPEEIAAGRADDSADPDGDSLCNLLEFAFGTDPKLPSSSLEYAGTFAGGGAITRNGTPIVRFGNTPDGVEFRALFIRRKDYAATRLTYTPQFSATIGAWQDSASPTVVLADDGTWQVCSVTYPFFAADKEARFFRIGVAIP